MNCGNRVVIQINPWNERVCGDWYQCQECQIKDLKAKLEKAEASLERRKGIAENLGVQLKEREAENERFREGLDYSIEKFEALHKELDTLSVGNIAHRKAGLRSICINAVQRIKRKWKAQKEGKET